MSRTVTLELPDRLYRAVKQSADAAGKSLADWIVGELDQRLPPQEEDAARLQVHPEIYEILKQVAPQMGLTLEEMVRQWKEKYGEKPRPQLTPEERRAAREQLLRHAGAASLGYPTGADNESIDADLAREYGSTHEEEDV